jgi:hypothetical protein
LGKCAAHRYADYWGGVGEVIEKTVEQVFYPLYGLPCWNAKSGYSGSLTMEFGNPFLQIREPRLSRDSLTPDTPEYWAHRLVTVRGQWHLWIHSCAWQVFTGQKRVGHSNLSGSSKRPIDRAAHELDGQKLVHIEVGPQGKTTVFEFDLGSRLESKPYNQTSDQWLLYEPSGYVFSLRGDGYYSHNPGNMPPDEKLYKLLKDTQALR